MASYAWGSTGSSYATGAVLRVRWRVVVVCGRAPSRSLAPYAACKSTVQCAQRVALMGMVDKQYGQSLVVGSPDGVSCLLLSRLTPFTSKKMTKAMMRKLMTSLM